MARRRELGLEEIGRVRALALRAAPARRLRKPVLPARLHLFDAAGRALAHGGERVA